VERSGRSLLQQPEIDSVVLEARSREYVERRIRAGLLEQSTDRSTRRTERSAGGSPTPRNARASPVST